MLSLEQKCPVFFHLATDASCSDGTAEIQVTGKGLTTFPSGQDPLVRAGIVPTSLGYCEVKWEHTYKVPKTTPDRTEFWVWWCDPGLISDRIDWRASLLYPQKSGFITHPWTGIIQHNKNDKDLSIPSSLNCCQDSLFALKEKAASVRDH